MPDQLQQPHPAYLEDLAVGQRFRTESATISEESLLAFAALYDPQPFHTDHEAAERSFFGGLAASGWQTAVVSMRLLVSAGFTFADGLIGAHADIAWPTPTRPGDVIHVVGEVLSFRESRSRPGRGIATMRYTTLTETGEERLRLTADWLVFRRR